MDEGFVKRLQSATRAAWFTILVGVIWMLAAWSVWIVLLAYRPGWLLEFWGGQSLTWDRVHLLMLVFMAASKLILFVFVMLAIWMTLWTRQLKRSADG